MKKLFLTVIVFTKLFSANAQNLSLNYTRNFLTSREVNIVNNKVVPQALQQLTVGYSQKLAKSNLKVNFAVAFGPKEPPWQYPKCESCTASLAKAPKGSILVMMEPQSTAVDVLVGLGYTFPHKAGSRLTLTANIDGGVSVNSKQELQVSYKEKIIDAIPFEKYQKIINPSLIMRIGITDRLGINLGGGYSNIGNFNLITGLSFGPSRKKEI